MPVVTGCLHMQVIDVGELDRCIPNLSLFANLQALLLIRLVPIGDGMSQLEAFGAEQAVIRSNFDSDEPEVSLVNSELVYMSVRAVCR